MRDESSDPGKENEFFKVNEKRNKIYKNQLCLHTLAVDNRSEIKKQFHFQ